MTFKLTKSEDDQLVKLKSDVSKAFSELEIAVNLYNKNMSALQDDLESQLVLYNQALAELRSFAGEVASDRRNEYDEKSDGWREGDDGSSNDEWISTWENADLEEVQISYPDQVEINFENAGDVDLPSEP